MWDTLLYLFKGILEFFHSWTHSWGLAIILLTVVVRLVLWPLTYSQVLSSKRLQEIQPDMERLRQRYKDDPARLNQEMMKLWRENKVNPMSGCFPMLVQFPFLAGMWQVLANPKFNSDLVGAPFLWIGDLAARTTNLADPSGLVLPVLAGVTTFIQSRMLTPQVAGPQQSSQRMMLWMMPALVTWISLSVPAGVGIYWVVSNLFSIGQQWMIPRRGIARGNSGA